jgi:hypothetical protein
MKGTYEKHFAPLIAHRGTVAIVSVFAVLTAISLAWSAVARSQAPVKETTLNKAEAEKLTATNTVARMKLPNAVELEAWRRKIIHVPREKATSCYQAKYPDATWHEVECKMIPQKANRPRVVGPVHPDQVGGASNADFVATTTNNITEVEGQFDSVTAPTSGNPTSYTLQTNTAPFSTSTCNGSTATGVASQPSCQGWQQFVYSTDNSGEVYIQYWLLGWGPTGATCKSPVSPNCNGSSAWTDGWCPFTGSDIHGNTWQDCVINGPSNTGIGDVSVPNLSSLTLTAYPQDASNASDNSIATISNTANHVNGANIFPDLKSNWTNVEFNIFGDGGGSELFFAPNTTTEVRTSVASNTSLGPGCLLESLTGESNNLTLVATTSNPAKANLPSLVFTETNVGSPTTAPCSSAISLGDTHIHPFNGQTEYDFQAYGDFLLAEAGPDFVVHTRQVPGPPGYPGTSTNTAVAVLMGRTRVAVYLQPARLVIDGKTTDLADGKTLELPSDILITHKGNEYFISDAHGNYIRADLVTSGTEALWMNVTVGLGRSPDTSARGLLGNPNDKLDEIRTARGVNITVPVDVKDLYGQFADSWRIDPAKSLFVELPPAVLGAPLKPLTARDLAPADKAHATEVCKAAGVKNQALLEDCILDTTVLKDDRAVKIYTRVAPPKMVIKPVMHELVK